MLTISTYRVQVNRQPSFAAIIIDLNAPYGKDYGHISRVWSNHRMATLALMWQATRNYWPRLPSSLHPRRGKTPLGPVERVPSGHHCSSVFFPSLSQVFPTPLLYAYPSIVNFGKSAICMHFRPITAPQLRVKMRELQRPANHWQSKRLGKLPLLPGLSSCWSSHATA